MKIIQTSLYFFLLTGLLWQCTESHVGTEVLVSGELKKWHKITLTFDGPESGETAQENPFMDYRLNVTFFNGEKTYIVPGYFAADGDAANTSAAGGHKWRVHFAPSATGRWQYTVSFRKGKDIAVSDDPKAGESAGFMDGQKGYLGIGETDKTGRDFRGKGRLEYVGEHFLRFAETGEYFLKIGADAPENLLAYADFDGDFKTDGHRDDLIKTWEPHLADWREGDPVWQGNKGKALIGAINYLASEGMNAFSFLTLNIAGDDHNVFPYTNYDERYRMDISKLDQWEIIMEHADQLGMFLHFKTQEAENQGLLDDGEVGPQRKLYYRELIARFGHHLALNWNLGEENGSWMGENHQTPPQYTPQRLAMAQYFYDHDPYHHHIVIHNGAPYDDLLGPESKITGPSLQTHHRNFDLVHPHALRWRRLSKEAGKPWVITVDEPGDAQHALLPDEEDMAHDTARTNALWGALMAGAAGIEWYFGYQHAHSDLSCQDWRSRDLFWDQCRYALEFFTENDIPFWELIPDDELTAYQQDYCFYKPGEVYVIYQKIGAPFKLNFRAMPGSFEVRWFNPRTGVFASETVKVEGNQMVEIPAPPAEVGKDWVVLMSRSSSSLGT